MSKHTPGPWRVVEFTGELDNEDALHVGISFQKRHSLMTPQPIAGSFYGFKGRHEGRCKKELIEVRANARLIAAAPELLEACRQALRALHTPGTIAEFDAREACLAAIAKAGGEE